MESLIRKLRRWARDDQGSMTLEVSMLFPWVLLVTFLLILLSIVFTQRTLLYYSASVAGERGAFAWPHSAADVRTGSYPDNGYDGLYWRLQDDALLAGLFGWSSGPDGTSIGIGGDPAGYRTGLAEAKLRKTAEALPAGIGGTIAYRNQVWLRKVTVDASGGKVPDPLQRFRLSGERKGSVSVAGVVTEPAEWIRTFDFVRRIKADMNQSKEGAATYRNQAASVLEQRR